MTARTGGSAFGMSTPRIVRVRLLLFRDRSAYTFAQNEDTSAVTLVSMG